MAITDALPDMEREIEFFPVENKNPQTLTRDQIDQFNERGYLCPLDIFTPEETEANRRYFDELIERAKATVSRIWSDPIWSA